MKKAISVLVIVTILFAFSGCGAKEDGAAIPSFEDFVSNVSFFQGEKRVSGVLCCSSGRSVSFTLTEPESIKGIVFSANESESSIGYKNLSISENGSGLTIGSKGIDVLFEIVFSAYNGKFQKMTGSQYKIQYSFGEAIVTSGKGNCIESIRAGEYEFTFTGMSADA